MENNLILLEDLLTEEGYNVESAVNGKDALAKLHVGKEYDLIISDILMPVMDGFMLCENVKRDEELRNVPFIFLSASFIGDKDEELAIKLGAKRFIRKPYDPEGFLKVVQGLLNDVDDSKVVTPEICFEDDIEAHKLYNERLVEKLEEKISTLEYEISERKKAEEMLRESEAKYRAMFESSKVGMATCEMDGTMIECNQAYLDIIGYTKEETLHLSYWDVTPTEYAENEARQLYLLKETGQYGPYEKEYIRKDGNRIPVLLNGVIINGANGSKYIWSVVQEIAEYSKLKQTLLKSEKLKSLGILTAGVSHEFNNILAIISANVQLLKETYKDHEELSKALCIILSAVDDGTQISSNMLKFTKTEGNADEFVAADIRDLVIQSIDFTSPKWKNEAQANGIDYYINKDGMEIVSSIMCNPSELREVFINIIINALDAMPDGGNLSFSTWSDVNIVFVSIADTGIGMSDETKKNIFNIFFTTKKELGTGLGMSLSHGIIIRHGGNIEVESEEGNGTTFTLQFPIADERTSQIETHKAELDLNVRNLRVLVVDDEDVLCFVLDQFFSKYGNNVKTANNGADAIDMAKIEDFDLVLCDLVMPDISGYEVIAALNKLEKRPKVGILTGWGDDIKPMNEDVYFDFILKKPFCFAGLKEQINDLEF